MSSMIPNSKNNLLPILMAELWENAPFSEVAYLLLEKFAQQQIPEIEFINQAKNILATIRNRNLITSSQQNILRNQVVGFFGLSVGSHAALTWIMESRAAAIKIIDPDIISPSNLNRLRLGWNEVGHPKTAVLAEELKKINPDLSVYAFNKSDANSIQKLFIEAPRMTAIVDSIDDFEGKILLRKLSKTYRIPLLSAADVGDNVVLDVERYDLTPQPKLFLGLVPDAENLDFKKLTLMERRKMIIKLVGFEHNSEALLDSLLSLGKQTATWPQLGATATIAGGVVATSLKKIFLKEKLVSGRYYVSLDDILVSNNNSKQNIRKRQQKIKQLKAKFTL